MKLDPFYLIVDSAEWIARLVPLGVKLVQLRIKDRPEITSTHLLSLGSYGRAAPGRRAFV
ncbi:hypothetical protein HFO61_07880 [Rhizobium leguminosarum]|nr:hypothetical protein [Rhizobium laguerreae]MBY5412934.1 hypothetical protein [Rhizobium leguminosarum]MBY5546748.1 hypothetical protein [Rhizobium leguminosarum]MBY5558133.1 hypothetical protein [Rhizobium leguminosarum]QSW27855.1 hypothetical protein J0664_32425 [Rhizobium leguminosarum]